MGRKINFLSQAFLIGIALFVILIFTAHHEFDQRNTLLEHKPRVFKRDNNLVFRKVPLETPHPIDNIEVSLVMPAYNEENRLPHALSETIKFFNSKQILYEIIIINDGSTDHTLAVMEDFIRRKYPGIELIGITFQKNGGKGYAVTTGMKYARGKYILMLDSDGATDIRDFDKLYTELKKTENSEKDGIAIGSRSHRVEEVVSNRAWYRNIMMHVNNFIVKKVIGVGNVKDTQCGFKLFTRETARKIFFNLHLVRWAFDVEMLYIARKLNIKVIEIPVNWMEIEGSKLNIVSATMSFFRDYFAMLSFYGTGFWNIQQ